MAMPWEDSVKTRNPKQLTIFVAPTLSKPWRRAFDDALKTFNHLSQAHRLGVTMTAPANATKPEHTIYGPDADLFIQQPQPFSGPFNKPDEDRFVLHIPTGSKPNVVSPPIFLKTAIADLIRDNWA
jgi:hypothetical protein